MNKKKKLMIVLFLLALIGAGIYAVKSSWSKTVEQPKTTETAKNDKTAKEEKKTVKEDKSDKKNDKKEDKKSDTKVEETSTATDNNTSNNTSATVTETTNNNVSNNTSNTSYNQPTSTPCVPTYTTINHEAVGHYETQVVTPAWDEAVYAERIVGIRTGRVYNSVNEFLSQDEDGNYTVKQVQVDTIHHDAVTQQVWVIDQQAWTETVASGC